RNLAERRILRLLLGRHLSQRELRARSSALRHRAAGPEVARSDFSWGALGGATGPLPAPAHSGEHSRTPGDSPAPPAEALPPALDGRVSETWASRGPGHRKERRTAAFASGAVTFPPPERLTPRNVRSPLRD